MNITFGHDALITLRGALTQSGVKSLTLDV